MDRDKTSGVKHKIKAEETVDGQRNMFFWLKMTSLVSISINALMLEKNQFKILGILNIWHKKIDGN